MDYFNLPSFMKKFNVDTSLNELRIPPEFVSIHGADLSFDCRFVMPRGRSWPVRLLKIASGCHFHAGWADFRIINNIVHDDYLTFTMVDDEIFHVKRYNPRTGCPPLCDVQEPEIESSDDEDYAPDQGVIDDDGCPTFVVTLDWSNIKRSLEIPFAFWRRHIRMNALQDPVYFNVNGDTWYIVLDHNDSKIWVKRGWRRFKNVNYLVAGTRCHFKLIDRNEVQFYVWFDRP
ncbi:B3 domain-containing protein At1g16640-like [Salvia hispanica]|uniref:B3 domain-containing protein At1g16640-like n=1 Tax=Salvia hispanica TaxID=49212 RepID=UPI002009C90C|nr:B3 domain-containing protein At1g16640-like [Salvia hispanica]